MAGANTEFSCIILAGGRGQRMHGSDKGLVEFRGRPLIEHVIDIVTPQVSDIVISANRNLPRYQSYGFPVITDSIEGFAGPLAGIASALPACKHNWVLVTPCDMPFLPGDLVTTLYDTRNHGSLVAIEAGGRLQLVFLLRKNLLDSISAFLRGGRNSVMSWLESQPHHRVEFSTQARAFDNFNSPLDLET